MAPLPSSPPSDDLVQTQLAHLPGAFEGLQAADRLWSQYRQGTRPVPSVIQETDSPLASIDWDVVICGGTLGILMGAALAQQGWRVAVIERGPLRGRDQEWNISRNELQVLLDLNLLTSEELQQAIATEYNPARVGFHKGIDLWVENILNIGIDPVYLLDRLKVKFLTAGGFLLEHTGFAAAIVHDNGIAIQLHSSLGQPSPGQPSPEQPSPGQPSPNDSSPPSPQEPGLITLHSRLLLDCMGHFSPIAQQARQGQAPDAVCLVVGTCAQGFPPTETGDLFVSTTPIRNHCQYFWEAFPARDGRTTYLFTYVDAHPDRPSLTDLFRDYFHLLPDYQSITLEQLTLQRALYGFFPCYRNSPLQPTWNRILASGDSSGSQSPLSFGGFGAMMRHLQRLSRGLHEALQDDKLDRASLALLQPYQPSLSVTWLFQRAMSVGLDQPVSNPDQINTLLSGMFQTMEQLGEPVLKPFLQDVVQFPALLKTLALVSVRSPTLGLSVIPQVGLPALLDWLQHFLLLGIYAGLYKIGQHLEPTIAQQNRFDRYTFHRWLDAWQYGSGNDYRD